MRALSRNVIVASLVVVGASVTGAAEETAAADPKLLDLLRKALKYDHPDVRARAVSAFVWLGPRAKACARDLAEALVDEKDSSRRRNVAHALVRIGPAAVPEVSALVLVADPKSLRELALAARRAKPAPVGILKALGGCSDPEVQRNVREGLRRVGAGQDTWLPGQLEGMGKQDSASRRAFLQNLGHEKVRAEHVPFLIAWLKDRDPEVRQQAAALLGKAKPPTKAVAEALFALADDGNMMVMSMAVNGLGDMGEIAVEYLGRVLEHRNQGARMMAAINLGKIGPAAKGALPALRKAMASGDGNLQAYLLKAEAKITGDSGKAVAELIEAIRKNPRRGKKWK
ncbi:MAG: HEAT repeat domain-containing protein [Planctomycetota bacterium]|jgi:HEAT repeat protein